MPPDWPGARLREALARASSRHRPLVEDYLGAVLGTSGVEGEDSLGQPGHRRRGSGSVRGHRGPRPR